MSDILTTEQAASMLQFSVPYTRALAAKGFIPAIQLGDDWRFVKQQVIDFIAQCAVAQQQARKHEADQKDRVAESVEKKGRGRPRKTLV